MNQTPWSFHSKRTSAIPNLPNRPSCQSNPPCHLCHECTLSLMCLHTFHVRWCSGLHSVGKRPLAKGTDLSKSSDECDNQSTLSDLYYGSPFHHDRHSWLRTNWKTMQIDSLCGSIKVLENSLLHKTVHVCRRCIMHVSACQYTSECMVCI